MIYTIIRKFFIVLLSIPLMVICLGGLIISMCVITCLLPFAIISFIIKSNNINILLKNVKKYLSYYKDAAEACYLLAFILFEISKEYDKF